MLHLENKSVLIVGGGKVAARKATALLEVKADVVVLSPSLDEAFDGVTVHWIRKEYEESHKAFSDFYLIFAATDSPELNKQIGQLAKASGVFVNVLDNPAVSSFHNMAIIEKAPFTIGISSNGASPALLNIVKERIAASISDGLVNLASWLGNLRSMAKVTIEKQDERQALYERIVSSEVLSLLEAGKHEEAQMLFNQLVEEAL